MVQASEYQFDRFADIGGITSIDSVTGDSSWVLPCVINVGWKINAGVLSDLASSP